VRITCIGDTEPRYVEFRAGHVFDAHDFGENTLVEVSDQGTLLAITIEHAESLVDLPRSSYLQVAA
jgi:uncharacterized protein YuzE